MTHEQTVIYFGKFYIVINLLTIHYQYRVNISYRIYRNSKADALEFQDNR